MKITIPFLVAKQTAGGIRYYWTPSPALRSAGWKTVPLGRDAETAQASAKARNLEIDTWRNGGAKPREIKAIVKRQTFSALIAEYRDSAEYKRLAVSTRREYGSCLTNLEKWAGEQRVDWITRARVQVLKDELLTPASAGGPPRYARARNVLVVLYNVMQIAVNGDRIAANPAARAKIPTAPPRDRVVSQEAIDAICRRALADGLPAIELGVRLGFAIMQREADILHLTEHSWKECEHDVDVLPEDWPHLVGADGRVLGFQLRQRKSRRYNRAGKPIKVPVIGEMRARVEAAIAANRVAYPLRHGTPIVIDPETGDQWADWKFQRRFRAVVNAAIEDARAVNDVDLVDDLTGIEFRDLRRSGAVHLFEMGIADISISAITGWALEKTKKILEVYAPRNARMAASAVAGQVTRLELRRDREAARKKDHG